MVARRLAALLGILAVTSLGGCSQTIGLYHDAEGGAITKHRQPPPGANLPYPNLADVPAAPGTEQQPQPTKPEAPSPALAALSSLPLPSAPPPLPTISGLSLASGLKAPALATAPVAAPTPAPAPVVPTNPSFRALAAPVVIAFVPGTALLTSKQRALLAPMGVEAVGKHVRVCGFGDGSLVLALARARRLANELTAIGVLASSIDVEAFASGSGGFVQLVY